MPRQVLAIANYRVSSDEQLLNNSLMRQEQSVIKAADELGVKIVQAWSGSVSSKKWSNFDRDDLLEMLQTCKRNPNIKFAIFDGCGRYLSKQDLHPQIIEHIENNPITNQGVEKLIRALNIVWKQKEGQAEQDAIRIKHKITSLNEAIRNQVEAATDPQNLSIKNDILSAISKKKTEVEELSDELETIQNDADSDKEQFLRFAFDFVDNMGSRFLEITQEDRLRCKQVLFPAGFYLDSNNKVYTPEISKLIRLAAIKKDLPEPEKSLLVRVPGLKPGASSLARKRSIN